MTTMMDILLIMFPSENFVKTDVKTDLGFVIGKFKLSQLFFMEYLSWYL